MIFAISGSTWKSRNALTKIVSAFKSSRFPPKDGWTVGFAAEVSAAILRGKVIRRARLQPGIFLSLAGMVPEQRALRVVARRKCTDRDRRKSGILPQHAKTVALICT